MPEHPDWWMVSAAFIAGLFMGFHACRRAVMDALEGYLHTQDAKPDKYVRIPHPSPGVCIIPPQGGSGMAPDRLPKGRSTNYPQAKVDSQ